ncbi:MAG: formate dehydrogenase accessory protein FdhE [Dehalococcoidales bacterium]|nr:formate dehydrogenase accessory protein FdhE [Dehalococcoidales bacterium]
MNADTAVLSVLAEWEKKEGTLSEALALQKRLLVIRTEIKSRIKPAPVGDAAARARLQDGRPIIEFDDLDANHLVLKESLERVIALFREFSGEVPESLTNLINRPDLVNTSARAWFESKLLPFPPGENSIAAMVLHAALKPFLTGCSDVLSDMVNQEQWKRGYCPVCGGAPDFAFLDKERGARWLLCSRCDMEWLFQRLECPVCGNQDQKTLAYFTGEGDNYRVYVCEKCKRYLKAIDLRQAQVDILLPLERLITTDLDVQAQAMGYIPCTAQMIGDRLEKRIH